MRRKKFWTAGNLKVNLILIRTAVMIVNVKSLKVKSSKHLRISISETFMIDLANYSLVQIIIWKHHSPKRLNLTPSWQLQDNHSHSKSPTFNHLSDPLQFHFNHPDSRTNQLFFTKLEIFKRYLHTSKAHMRKCLLTRKKVLKDLSQTIANTK